MTEHLQWLQTLFKRAANVTSHPETPNRSLTTVLYSAWPSVFVLEKAPPPHSTPRRSPCLLRPLRNPATVSSSSWSEDDFCLVRPANEPAISDPRRYLLSARSHATSESVAFHRVSLFCSEHWTSVFPGRREHFFVRLGRDEWISVDGRTARIRYDRRWRMTARRWALTDRFALCRIWKRDICGSKVMDIKMLYHTEKAVERCLDAEKCLVNVLVMLLHNRKSLIKLNICPR